MLTPVLIGDIADMDLTSIQEKIDVDLTGSCFCLDFCYAENEAGDRYEKSVWACENGAGTKNCMSSWAPENEAGIKMTSPRGC